MRRYDGIVRAASDAALAKRLRIFLLFATATSVPALGRSTASRATCLRPMRTSRWNRRQLTDWLTEATKHQLLLHGYPAEVIDHFDVSFVSHEEIVRKAGGNYHHYFN